jgi:ABC-type multidrug transport system fused ATPase/permease subunit
MVIVIITAFVASILFSLSFATIIPLLKVMMGEEGLHGWVDRNVCKWRYGVQFYVPDRSDLLSESGRHMANSLAITSVKEDSILEKAGLKPTYRITGVGSYMVNEHKEELSSIKLLAELATAPGKTKLPVKYQHIQNGKLITETVNIQVPPKPFYVENIQNFMSLLPRDQMKENKEKGVIFIIVVMGIVTIARCICRFLQTYMGEKIIQIAVLSLRQDTFTHVMKMPIGFFSGDKASDTTSRIIGDISASAKGVNYLMGKALREPLNALFLLLIAMWISWELTIIFLTIAPLTIGLLVLIGKRIKKASRKKLRSGAKMLGKIQSVMSAMSVVKVYNRQEHETKSYKGLNRRFLRQTLRVTKANAATGPLMEVLGMLTGSAALLVGVHWVSQNKLEPSMFFGLLVILGTCAESIRKMSNIWPTLQQAEAAAERVYEIIDHEPEVEAKDGYEIEPLKEKIEFKDVVFSYPSSRSPVLNGVNLTVNAGQTVAVVGPNGSGKTTLVNLIPRFYNVDSGQILIDEQDTAKATLKSLRSQISMVTQKIVTFNSSIADNIAYSKPEAKMEEIVAAAKKAYAHEFIEVLPDGYETEIGEQGGGFSGGQLQRIVIARAILKDPSIMILDEATSQIDAESESKIHKALEEVMKNRTCFIIAHRFSTVISADSIVVLDAGRVIAQGQHSQLVEHCPLYKSLYETQLL